MTSVSFKEFEHQAWQQAVEQYDASFSRLTQQTIPAILDALSIQKGTRLLDVACGPGYLAAAAYQKGAEVCGVDFSSAMLLRAKQLHPLIAFHEDDAEILHTHPDRSFDAVAMNFGIIHLGEPEKALKAAERVLKLGGKIAFTAWCPPQEAVGFSLVLRAVEQFGNLHIVLPTAPPLFFYGNSEHCKQALLQCGFTNATTQIIHQLWEIQSPDELFEAFLKGTARTAGLLKRQSSEQLTAIRKAIRQEIQTYMLDGKITIPMPAILAYATKTALSRSLADS
jgi:ubiquinone/menaquinone biosynthesis C-methylase UbiE